MIVLNTTLERLRLPAPSAEQRHALLQDWLSFCDSEEEQTAVSADLNALSDEDWRDWMTAQSDDFVRLTRCQPREGIGLLYFRQVCRERNWSPWEAIAAFGRFEEFYTTEEEKTAAFREMGLLDPADRLYSNNHQGLP